MQTITSPNGNTHLIRTHPATYRGVHSPTTTWCGIRATRDWAVSGTATTCNPCRRRHAEAEAAAGP